jgi:hypothetical protein
VGIARLLRVVGAVQLELVRVGLMEHWLLGRYGVSIAASKTPSSITGAAIMTQAPMLAVGAVAAMFAYGAL